METPKLFTYDDAKDRQNRREHDGISLVMAERFEFARAVFTLDTRDNYGEDREVAIGFIGQRLHVLVFTLRGTTCRVISLRKANKAEAKTYADEIS